VQFFLLDWMEAALRSAAFMKYGLSVGVAVSWRSSDEHLWAWQFVSVPRTNAYKRSLQEHSICTNLSFSHEACDTTTGHAALLT